MRKIFHLKLPLPLEESFTIVSETGHSITSWSKSTSDPANGYIDWKQSIWALTGSAVIIARLEQTGDRETSVAIEVHKPFQVIDPFFICNLVFKKFARALKKRLASVDSPGTPTVP